MSAGPPIFSVIIPTFNRAELLRRALASVAAQTFRDFEVVACDDGSTDHTARVVDSFRDAMDLRHVREENWGGPARPRNNGIRAARGRWVCFLDSDDWWYPEKLARVRERTGDADVIYHDVDFIGPRGTRRVRLPSRQVEPPVFRSLMTRENHIVTSSVCVRKSILDEAGPFSEDPDYVAMEDFDLWLRISLITDRFVLVPRRLGAYWEEAGNLSAAAERLIRGQEKLFRSYASRLDGEERKEMERLRAFYTGVIRKNLGHYPEGRACFRESLFSRDPRVRWVSLALLLRMSVGGPSRVSG